MRFGLALMILVGLAAPAVACINDSELPNHEREFRSNYADPAAPEFRSNYADPAAPELTPHDEFENYVPTPTPTPTPPRVIDLADYSSHPVLLGSGTALLTGAFLATRTGRRARS